MLSIAGLPAYKNEAISQAIDIGTWLDRNNCQNDAISNQEHIALEERVPADAD